MSQEGIKKNTPPGVDVTTEPSRYESYARIFKPGGRLAVPKPAEDFDGLLIAEIDLDETHLMKSHADFGGHYMRPDLIRLLVDTSRKELVTELDPNGGIKSYSTAHRLGLDQPLVGKNAEEKNEIAGYGAQ
jgi:cyanide hydratase